MDFALSEEQEMLRTSARDFLEKECPKTLVREMETDERGYSTELWRKMAELGWMGLVFPEEYDGTGGSFLDLTILIEEMGRALLPAPFIPTVVYCGLPILEFGTEEQKREFVSKIGNGEIVMTLALTEPSARYDAAGIEVKATAEGDDYVINGTKLFVPDAHVADWLLCVARTKEAGNKEEGITLFLVPGKSPGISYTLLKTVALDKQCEVTFDKVRVPKKNILGQVDKGWEIVERIMEQAAMAHCAYMLGGAQQVLEMSVDYAKDRVQFDRPIGSFQAIQHKCADIATDVDGIRFITYEAAWKLSEGILCSLEVSMAKAWVSDAYRRVCVTGHQVHGGVGVTLDHDMQLYYRRAKMHEVFFGDGDFHRELVAQELGL
jgi:alkylation response protein AidB-like acyl-CoA dehydrogenase